jgi:DnaK suppressor protein
MLADAASGAAHAGRVQDDVATVLAAERAEVVGRIAGLRRELDELIQASVGDNADDEHDPEGATIAFERAQLSSLLTATERRLAEIDRTVASLDAGTYGTCERCGRPIGAERLAARPSATSCVSCASA